MPTIHASRGQLRALEERRMPPGARFEGVRRPEQMPPSTLEAIRALGLERRETPRMESFGIVRPLERQGPAGIHPDALRAMAVAAARREVPIGARFGPVVRAPNQAGQLLRLNQMQPEKRAVLMRFGKARARSNLFQ